MGLGCTRMVSIVAVGVLGLSASANDRGMGIPVTYQGQLKQAGQPLTGLVDFRFSLWDAGMGGGQVGSDYTPADPVDVTDGLFTAVIDTTNFGPDAFNGDPRWLEIEVWEDGFGWVLLSPRQMLTASPFAMYAFAGAGGGECLWSQNGSNIYFDTGNVGIGQNNATTPLQVQGDDTGVVYVQNIAASGYASALTADAESTSGAGVVGHANSSSGYTLGVAGHAYSPLGVGVRGTNGADTGDAIGVEGRTSSADGIGVRGLATDSSGTGSVVGVKGQIANPSGAALWGEATASTGTAHGVWAVTAAPGGTGVSGQNTAATGETEGVMGIAWSGDGRGVFGYNGSTGSGAVGVLGRCSHGEGVRGEATHTSATNYGVLGETASVNGFGVYGTAPSAGKGVVGYSGSSDYGYLGYGGGGVYGRSTDGYGVRGYSANDWAIYGSVPNGVPEAGVVGAVILDNGGTLWKSNSGVSGGCQDGQGVAGRSIEGIGVFGEHVNSGNIGQLGTSTSGATGEHDSSGNFGWLGNPTSGVWGESFGVYHSGVHGVANNATGYGVYGVNGDNYGYIGWSGGGVNGTSTDGVGVRGYSTNDWGVYGVVPDGSTQAGVVGAITLGSGGVQWVSESGVCGSSEDGYGVSGRVDGGRAVYGTHDDTGNFGYLATPDEGAYGEHGATGNFGQLGTATAGVYGESDTVADNGVRGVHTLTSNDTPAVYGAHDVTDWYGIGVKGVGGYRGVEGNVSPTGDNSYSGVRGEANGGTGVNYGVFGGAYNGNYNYGVYGSASGGTTNYAGYFAGNVHCSGTLSKASGTFMIDHPLDPENKYLFHSFVESPDMMNIYNGNVELDANGEAVVTMPEWFEALNMDFRYQLTCIGGFAQVYIAEEIADNQFKIAGGKPGLKVSWQVTGIRQDPFANANRVQVEVDKPASERGTYLHPEAWGVPAELQVDRFREARELQGKEAAAFELAD